MTTAYTDYLAHHGVKGQKWGVRRYQNEDGTMTALGKKLKAGMSKPKSESSTWKAKDAGTLSDEELRRRLTRLQQEKQYKEMTASKATKARKWIAKTAGKILVTTAVAAAAGYMTGKYKDALNYKLPDSKNVAKAVAPTAIKKARGQW